MARPGTFKCAAVTDVKAPSLSAARLLNEPHVRWAGILASPLPTHVHHLPYSGGRDVRTQSESRSQGRRVRQRFGGLEEFPGKSGGPSPERG